MSLASEYLDLYKQFELWAQNTMGVHSITDLQGDPMLWRYERKIEFFRHVRNMLTHDCLTFEGEEMVAVKPSLIEGLRQLIADLQRTARDMMVPARNVFKCRKDQKLSEVIRTMRDYQYTYVPVIEEGKVIGVFSANTLLLVYDEVGVRALPEAATIADIIGVADINHCQDTCLACVPETPMVAIQSKFATYSHNGERLDLVIITEDGTFDSRFLGLITAWDVLGV